MQSLKKNWLLVSKIIYMTNLVNFNASSGKSENLHFDVLPLSIAYKVSAKKSAEEWSKLRRKIHYLFEKLHEQFDEF